MKQESSNLERIIGALALLAIGVCFVVWADKITDWLSVALGVLALITAIVRAIKFFKAKPSQHASASLFSVILVAAVGLLLVSRADFVKEAISFIVGIYIILSSSVQIAVLSSLRHRGPAASRSFVYAILGIVIGILCVIGKFIVPDALAVLTGVSLIVYSIIYLLGLFTIQKVVKTAKSNQKKITEATIVKEAKEAEVVKPSQSKKK